MRKKRILLCNEASYLLTGYSTYGREVMRRLYATGKYELAELGGYSTARDPRAKDIPWKFYPNTPNPENEEAVAEYNSVPTNQFGEFRFEDVLLDFKPDIVFDIRDFWMIDFQERSPFRRLFHWVIMPTVDSYPQNEQWLATYSNADAVFNYSEFGMDVLKNEGGGHINCKGVASPSADAAYVPVEDKRQHKEDMGLSPDTQIIGTVMRNQRRKLYPDLFETFRKFLDKTQRPDVYLYCHTSYPDLGWDIPKLINKHGLSGRVLFTYVCSHCKETFPSFFQDAIARCPTCGVHAAGLSNVQRGVSTETLSKIINTFDLYIQYANSEGFGLPQVEAAACGVPVMSVDYSAMSSVVKNLEGVPLKCKSLFLELETGCYRAIPDNDYAAEQIEKFFAMDKEEQLDLSNKVRQNFLEIYQWDKTAKIWEDYFDSVTLPPTEQTWGSPPRLHQPSQEIPKGLSNSQYVKWLIVNVLGEPEKLNTYMEARMTRDLNYKVYIEGTGGMYTNEDVLSNISKPQFQNFDEEIAYHIMASLCERRNYWERLRVQS